MKCENTQPAMMTIREIARTGLLSEHALRIMLKAGKLPAIYIGNKALINYGKLCEQLTSLESDITTKPEKQWYE
ncbi:hypothetical protein SDC9_98017 [bioreactor metagenome]|uniref:Helix-turn-helix domain-containing protein n=1 Tax=bioreactor metagenome TaxID=1076179 RepID=A0A645ADL7_9ZZZZ|nr:hypothetical protein [Candidatus Metalachnospira sp.]